MYVVLLPAFDITEMKVTNFRDSVARACADKDFWHLTCLVAFSLSLLSHNILYTVLPPAPHSRPSVHTNVTPLQCFFHEFNQ